MHKVILDCDNTMGVKRSDIDDGLTFAYLYAHPKVQILGITCTFANNHEHVVYYNTVQMLEDMGIKDVPVFKGGRKPGEYDSDAVDFLADTVRENPGEVVVIAIGSLCNIAGAYKKNPSFFEEMKQLIIMGGILEPLYLNGALCRELNFSVDSDSASQVIFNCHKVTILSSQCTQMAVYGSEEIDKLKKLNTGFLHKYMPIIEEWVDYINASYGNRKCFINWDLCTAVYLTNPELFRDKVCRVVKCSESMKEGLIVEDKELKYSDEEVNYVNIPEEILDMERFNQLFYGMMERFNG